MWLNVLVLLLGLSCSQARVARYFITGNDYLNVVLKVKPFKTLRGENGARCGTTCSIYDTCWAYAVSCTSCPNATCHLYNTNICRSQSVGDTSYQKHFRLFERRNFPEPTAAGLKEIRMTCKQLVTLSNCLQNNYGRCAGCSALGFHGSICQYIGSGCPASFQYSSGTCYNVIPDHHDHNTAQNFCNGMLRTSNLAIVHKTIHNNFLSAWLRDYGSIKKLLYIGLKKGNSGSWVWIDGKNINEVMPPLWAVENDLDGVTESVVSVKYAANMSVQWYDAFQFPKYGSICRSKSIFNETSQTSQCNSPFLTKEIDGGCYFFNSTTNNFTDSISNCQELNASLLCVASAIDNKYLQEAFSEYRGQKNISFYIGVQVQTSGPNRSFSLTCLNGTLLSDESPVWAYGEPSQESKQCATIDISLNSYMWIDYPCSYSAAYACEYMANTCSEWMKYGHKVEGLFYFKNESSNGRSFRANCKFDVENKLGWTVIHLRTRNGSLNFDRPAADFEAGFYSPDNSEYWIGNRVIYDLTKLRPVRLRIELQDSNNETYLANYDEFQLANYTHKYHILSLGNFTGNASDGLELDAPFVTAEDKSCQQTGMHGGWWIQNCSNILTNLNGIRNNWMWDQHLNITASKMMIV